jgi:hypothetical protein
MSKNIRLTGIFALATFYRDAGSAPVRIKAHQPTVVCVTPIVDAQGQKNG